MSRLFETLKRLEAQGKSLDDPVVTAEKNIGEDPSLKNTSNLIKRLRLPVAILLMSALIGYLLSTWILDYITVDTNNSSKKMNNSRAIIEQVSEKHLNKKNKLPSSSLKREVPKITINNISKTNLVLKPKGNQVTNTTKSKLELKNLLNEIQSLKGKTTKAEGQSKTNREKSLSPRAEEKITIKDPYASQKTLKLIQLAEELRMSGDLNGSVNIYRRLWKETHSPLVANNLGAILILMGKYKEAKNLLETAIKLSPDDEDLKYNLRLVNYLNKQIEH
ncbi:hypothetical protein DBT_1573 [Dissulfuribacter thermophilus]|uniref:Uncharacterized protein n=1 Tax=Dissulfuribacter thermophilus TaxID=1156395 RepID=A0A1B9F562_9BACT|nr:tetratricopeptide repeat protein [Dissulfuribacter thermophilus]OCC15087.1 hypothetical protein DBT_1573 [Dissulfuribacter thermophilus]